MNFLEQLPVEIFDMILQYLSGRDLMNLSEVSRHFYSHVAEGRCMDKIVLNVSEKFPLESIESIFTSREYRHMKISHLATIPMSPLFNTLHSLTISEIYIPHLDDLLLLMWNSRFVREITLDRVYIRVVKRTRETPALAFDNLRVLNLHCCHAVIYHEVFRKCKNLECFTIKAGSAMTPTAERALKKILCNNTKLKVLSVRFNILGLLFTSDRLSKLTTFKLQKFSIGNLTRISTAVRKNMYNFLLRQIEVLEELSLDGWMGIEVMKLCFLMPRLRKLTLKGFHHSECDSIEWANEEFCKNPSIHTLHLYDVSSEFKIFRCIIDACENAKEFYFYSLNDSMATYLASKCLKIKSICVEKLLADSQNNPLKDLIKISKVS